MLKLPCTAPNPLNPGLYRTDPWNRNPLFSIGDRIVGSWNEAFALHGNPTLEDVNPDYVRALIIGENNSQVSPYTKIVRIPRSHYLTISKGIGWKVHSYNPFSQGASRMGEEDLFCFIRERINFILQSNLENVNSNIACEHSSGLDSNAVLASLLLGLEVPADRIHTISWRGGSDDPYMLDIRRYFDLHERQCHGIDLLWTYNSYDDLILKYDENLKVFGCPPQVGGDTADAEILQRNQCAVFFSGFGGDQALSHHGLNVGTDLSGFKQLHSFYSWYGAKYFPLKHFLSRSLARVSPQWAMSKTVNQVSRAKTPFAYLLIDSLTSQGRTWFDSGFKRSYSWEMDGFSPMRTSIRNRVLADWIAVRLEDESDFGSYDIRKLPSSR